MQAKIPGLENDTKQPRKRYFSHLTYLGKDLLLQLVSSLDLNFILELKHVSKRMRRNINTLLRDIHFWNMFPWLKVTVKDIEKIGPSTRIPSLRWLPDCSLATLDNNLQSVCKDTYPYYKKNNSEIFFNSESEKKRIWRSSTVSFALEELQPLIIKDRAPTFLRKASRLGDLCPFIQEPNLDLESILKVITFLDKSETTFIIGDLNFIAFLPHLIQFKATRCFDLVIRAWLGCYLSFEPIRNNELFSFKQIIDLICLNDNGAYAIRFLNLMILLYPVDISPCTLFEVIQYFWDNGMANKIHESLCSVTRERREIIMAQWRTLPLYTGLLQQLYVEEQCRAIMLAALTRSHGFFSTVPIAHLSAENLRKQQESLDNATRFGIETLQQKKP